MASTAFAIFGSSLRTANATRASSPFSARRISSEDLRSNPRERGFLCSVLTAFKERLKPKLIITVGEAGVVGLWGIPTRIVLRKLSGGCLAGREPQTLKNCVVEGGT